MRMWMVDPSIMCNKYLTAEHYEIHMFIGTISKGKSVSGFIKNNLLEPSSLYDRHNEIVNEMEKRNMFHSSDLNKGIVDKILKNNLTKEELNHKIDKDKALKELKERCYRDSSGVEHFGKFYDKEEDKKGE